jgi:hypothetical protein
MLQLSNYFMNAVIEIVSVKFEIFQELNNSDVKSSTIKNISTESFI